MQRPWHCYLARRMVCCCPARKLPNAMNDLPNFAAWSQENLANFCMDSYTRMQTQQEAIEELRNNLKNVSVEVKKLNNTLSNYFEGPL